MSEDETIELPPDRAPIPMTVTAADLTKTAELYGELKTEVNTLKDDIKEIGDRQDVLEENLTTAANERIDTLKNHFDRKTEKLSVDFTEIIRIDQDQRAIELAEREMEAAQVAKQIKDDKEAEARELKKIADAKKKYRDTIKSGIIILVVGSLILSALGGIGFGVVNYFRQDSIIKELRAQQALKQERATTQPGTVPNGGN
ncbi:MAG: hypothetical protein CMI54_02070 [Parcubacteria group bacterium]|jgi:hypothetical protein|nr:hypothetical protein [Parcubacteria group bacterium]|tara:strand:- start:3459 stop:4061 length:603 start_codon:yes stop_codon:yes gene_type:complete